MFTGPPSEWMAQSMAAHVAVEMEIEEVQSDDSEFTKSCIAARWLAIASRRRFFAKVTVTFASEQLRLASLFGQKSREAHDDPQG